MVDVFVFTPAQLLGGSGEPYLGGHREIGRAGLDDEVTVE
ncbi:hypothetical protein EDD40_2495 [Saccharothrix texasensis]|uniref:Uncharacterized protein n=1 Tax=Saccharothrix texasensis TaxID=103734 RepID=A0A3N1H3X7_9PSEU|nr:hypothetical protein EDD40_2495 [Saccharothrix texasensis]